MHDVLTNLENNKINCLDKGFVSLIDVMPRLVPESTKTADFAIVQAARVSYGDGTKTLNEDKGLIRYLMRHNHSTPFEMIEFKFVMKLPIFCARQIVRHRSASLNECSGRYSIMKDEYYFPEPDNVRQQSKANKQGGENCVSLEESGEFLDDLNIICKDDYKKYLKHLDNGVSREQARMMLSLNLYTEWYWKIDAKNLLHFLSLRCDSHSQWETKVYADAILSLIKPIIPITIEAWEDYSDLRGAMKLTRLEIEAIKNSTKTIASDNKREQSEWESKAKILGLV